MVYVWVCSLPKQYCQRITIPLHKLIHDSLLRIVITILLQHCFLYEVILHWVGYQAFFLFENDVIQVVTEEKGTNPQGLMI